MKVNNPNKLAKIIEREKNFQLYLDESTKDIQECIDEYILNQIIKEYRK